MPNDREQVADLPQPTVTPEAHPTDQFAAPLVQPPPDNERVRDISSALSQFNDSLKQWAGVQEFKYTKQDLEAGAALRQKSQGDWKRAVDSGQIPEGASPWFKMGYDRMDMKLQGQQYDSALHQAYVTSPVRNMDDPKALSSWVQSFQASWLKQSGAESNPMFNHTLAPMLSQAEMHLQQVHSQDRIQDVEVKARDSLSQLVGGIVGTRFMHPDQDSVTQSIQMQADEAYKMGMHGSDVTKIVGETIQRQAIMEGDVGVLDLLKKVNAGSGPISGTAYGKELIKSGQMAIFDRLRAMTDFERSQHEYQLKMVKEQGSQEALARLIDKGPLADVSDIAKRMNEAGDAEGANDVLALPKKFRATTEDNPVLLADCEARAISGDLKASELTKLAPLMSSTTIQSLSKTIEMRGRHEATMSDPFLNMTVQDLSKTLIGGDLFGRNLDPMLMNRVSIAKNTLMRDAMEWKDKPANKDATSAEFHQHIEEVQQQLVARFAPTAKVGPKLSDTTSLINEIEGKISGQKPQEPKSTPSNGGLKFNSLDELKAYRDRLRAHPETIELMKQAGVDPIPALQSEFKRLSPKAAAKGGANSQ